MSRRSSYAGLQQGNPALAGPGGELSKKSSHNGGTPIIESLGAAINLHHHEKNQRQQAASRRTSRSNDVTAEVICSQQSVLNVMDRFVKAVDNMDATVLLPSRLRDMDASESIVTSTGVLNPPYMQGDMHTCFTMLRDAKIALLWGPNSPAAAAAATGPGAHGSAYYGYHQSSASYGSGQSSPGGGGGSSSVNGVLRVPSVRSQPSHKRQPSNGSLGSTASSDPETDNDCSSLSDFADPPPGHDATFDAAMGGAGNMAPPSAGGPAMPLESSAPCGPEPMPPASALSNAFRVHLHALHAILKQMADSADYLATRYQNELEPPSSR